MAVMYQLSTDVKLQFCLSMAVVVPLEVLISKRALLGDEAVPGRFPVGPAWAGGANILRSKRTVYK